MFHFWHPNVNSWNLVCKTWAVVIPAWSGIPARMEGWIPQITRYNKLPFFLSQYATHRIKFPTLTLDHLIWSSYEFVEYGKECPTEEKQKTPALASNVIQQKQALQLTIPVSSVDVFTQCILTFECTLTVGAIIAEMPRKVDTFNVVPHVAPMWALPPAQSTLEDWLSITGQGLLHVLIKHLSCAELT